MSETTKYARRDLSTLTAVVRLSRDAVLTTKGENSSIFFTGACNDGYFNADGSESVSFIEFVIGGKRATEKVKEALKKGTKLTVIGRLRTWTEKKDDNTYINRYIVSVQDFDFGSTKPAEAGTTPAPTATAEPEAAAQGQTPMFSVEEDTDFGFTL